jgi:hypothetical protein
MARRRKPAAARAVFINCPFDPDYQPIFRAMVFTIIACGYVPRCALDATDGVEIRISKIAEMLGECERGIHDISRVEIDPYAKVPRFNMPLELGIHIGARLLGEPKHRRKKALVLEAERHRYDKSLSDISGQDIEAHGNKPEKVIEIVRNWLAEHRPDRRVRLPGAQALIGDYAAFLSEIPAVLDAERLDPLDDLPHCDYLDVIEVWLRQRAETA